MNGESDHNVPITIVLSKEARAAVNRYRGTLSEEAFIDLLLRMLGDQAISAPPGWIEQPKDEARPE